MKTISIRELHQETGDWVRKAASGTIVVTERGRPIADIVPHVPAAKHSGRSFVEREAWIKSMPFIPVDSATVVDEIRER